MKLDFVAFDFALMDLQRPVWKQCVSSFVLHSSAKVDQEESLT